MIEVARPTIDSGLLLNGNFHTPDELVAEAKAGDLFQRWPLRNLAHAYQEREPLKYLVDELLAYPSLSAVYGAPGSMKSMILCDLAVSVAAGQKWLMYLDAENIRPGITFGVTQAPILWIDFDNGRRRTDERMEAVARARQLPVETPIHYVSMPIPWLDISDLTMVTDLAKLINHLGAKLVVIDNLGLVTGGAEENSGAMAQVMGHLRWLCEETESAVVVIHHQRKSGGASDKGIRKGETLRGHSSIEAALDLALLVERIPGEDRITLIPTKVRGYLPYAAFGAHFTYKHKAGTLDLESARFYSRSVETKDDLENLTIEAVIRRVLDDEGPMNQKDLVDAVRDFMAAQPGGKAPGINKIRGLLKQMVDDGEVEEIDQGKNAKLYQT